LLVHIGGPSSNQATSLESQMIHMIQELFGQTLTGGNRAEPIFLACCRPRGISARRRAGSCAKLRWCLDGTVPFDAAIGDAANADAAPKFIDQSACKYPFRA
jgi:hypothetical protein